MKKSLQELKARSSSIAIQSKAAQIALDAKSPTDAFNLASAGGYFYPPDAEAIRYLAMIKRDHGLQVLKDFIAEKNNFAIASLFLDRVTTALAYLDFCQSVPSLVVSELSVTVSKLIEDIAITYRDNFSLEISRSGTETSKICSDRGENYGYCLGHIQTFFANSFPTSTTDGTFEHASSVLFWVGMAVAERHGLYFMRSLPKNVLQQY